jgi:hypothetical protein
MTPDTLWFAVAWSAAINGVFHPGTTPLPVLPSAIFLPVIIGGPLLLFSKRVGQVLDEIPASWLVALQLYRVFGSWALAAWLRGALPGVFALPAGIGDVLTGLLALPAAIAVAAGTADGRRAATLWNIFGLADFAVAITMGMITSPGPLQLIVPDVQSIGAGNYPGVLTPAFVVPSSILLHTLSLRQLRRRGRAEAGRPLKSAHKMDPGRIRAYWNDRFWHFATYCVAARSWSLSGSKRTSARMLSSMTWSKMTQR